MYEFNERVRYSETTEDGSCSILALVNYLQDCSTFHSEDAGVGISYLNRVHQAWLLSYWDIYIDRRPKVCERIIVGTCPWEVQGVMAHRNFWIREQGDKEARYLVRADSIWFNLNLDTGRPQKLTEDMIRPYGERKDVLGLEESARKIALPAALDACGALVIQPHHIDSNHHVNNAQYIALASEAAEAWRVGQGAQAAALARPTLPKRIRAEYRSAAVLGDTMIPHIGKTEAGGIVVSLKNKNGETYANVEFR